MPRALNCQNATSGVYKNSTVTFYGFPLHNKPLLKQWIHNMVGCTFPFELLLNIVHHRVRRHMVVELL
uniref:THAP-type domain-containing protein n=1 Tax=Chrysemys picta bellii TaxID=8478 RepID=A0A8C3HPE3_CHRPI